MRLENERNNGETAFKGRLRVLQHGTTDLQSRSYSEALQTRSTQASVMNGWTECGQKTFTRLRGY